MTTSTASSEGLSLAITPLPTSTHSSLPQKIKLPCNFRPLTSFSKCTTKCGCVECVPPRLAGVLAYGSSLGSSGSLFLPAGSLITVHGCVVMDWRPREHRFPAIMSPARGERKVTAISDSRGASRADGAELPLLKTLLRFPG